MVVRSRPHQDEPAVVALVDDVAQQRFCRLTQIYFCVDSSDFSQKLKSGVGVVLLSASKLTADVLNILETISNSQSHSTRLTLIVIGTAASIENSKLFPTIELDETTSARSLHSILQSTLRSRQQEALIQNLQSQKSEALVRLKNAELEAEKAGRAKSEFVANISHEIRTPLGVMLGFTELAEEMNRLPAELRYYLATVHRNGRQLLKLIEHVLDLSKTEAAHLEIEKTDFSIFALLNELHKEFDGFARAKKINFSIEIGNCIPQFLCSDRARVRQILFSLIENAIKFTDLQGAVTLRLDMASKSKRQFLLNFTIRDTGIGLSVRQKRKLFEAFSQADSSTTRRFGGSGLGLVVARKFAKALGGNIQIKESHLGKGSSFLFSVPIEPARSAALETNPPLVLENRKSTLANPLQGMTVLVVDDSKDNQLMIGRFLSYAGATVDLAENGVDGIGKALNKSYDAVLMDLQMPLLGGLEATNQLRDRGYGKPIIACTAHAMRGERERLLSAGFDAYLSKPIERKLLIETLRTL